MRYATGTALGAIWGAVAAMAAWELLDVTELRGGLAGTAQTAGASALLGAALAVAFARGRPRARALGIGAAFASFVALLVRETLRGWLDLSAFGAAPAGSLLLVVLPLSQGAAGLLLARPPPDRRRTPP